MRDSFELAWSDWLGSAQYDRVASTGGAAPGEDHWGLRWARAYVEFAAGEKRSWLRGLGVRFTPMVGWAERGDLRADGHGNSVPRFHLPWGTGTAIAAPFVHLARVARDAGLLTTLFRHRVDEVLVEGGAAVGVRCAVLADDDAPRGRPSNREVVGEFEVRAGAVLVTSGGIGANHELVREHWPARLGTPPRHMITGVPAHVDGRMLGISAAAGARLVNRDRMWHYTEGIRNWDPIWPDHAIRILPGPSPMWFDAIGRRLPDPYLPGHDSLGTLRHLRTDPAISRHEHSWFIVTQTVIEKEFALSGSEQNPDITAGGLLDVLRARLAADGAPAPVEAFKDHGEDFVVADTLEELVAGMNALTEEPLLDVATIRAQIEARDLQMANPYAKDAQVQDVHNARRFPGDRLVRAAAPHRFLDPAAGPLIGVMLHVLTRKTLGGIQTDLGSRALGPDGAPIPGLFAAGEVAGFGGGGVHGYNALEGTFLGGCLFSGRAAGRTAAAEV